MVRTLRAVILVLVAGFLAAIAVLYAAGSYATTPTRSDVGQPPGDLNVEEVSFADADGRLLKGWFADTDGENGAVILVHGIRADRSSMTSRARFLVQAGYKVLWFDLQAHGESDGDYITFGFLEAKGVTAAVDYVNLRSSAVPIAVIGVSLGGAASLMASSPLPIDALVLEAVYSSLDDALRNRIAIRLGKLPSALAPLLLWQVPVRLGYDPGLLSPLNLIGNVSAPVLVMSGGRDDRTTVENTRELYAQALEPKALLIVPDAGHVDLHRFATGIYENAVLAFLSEHMH